MKYGDLVSIIIATYNHEDFIIECLQAACSQTYPNVEVVVCDDCSTDKTFQKITEFAETYKGPSKLKFYKNEKNLGAIGNYQKCISLSSGDVIIEQDGDDIAMANRVEETVNIFIKDENVKALFSNAIYTDELGKDYGSYFKERPTFISTIEEFEKCKFDLNHVFTPFVWMLGATAAFSKDIFLKFDVIDPRARHEDGVFSFRAILLGRMIYIDKPLVRYRRHSNAVSAPQNFKGRIKLLRTEYYYFLTQYNDAIKINASKETLSKIKLYKSISYVKSKIFGFPFLGELILRLLLFVSKIKKSLVNRYK